MAAGAILSGAGSAAGGAASLIPAVFGTGGAGRTSGTSTTTGTTKQKLNIDEAGIQKIIEDVLGGADGLASIFSGEQSAGIFDSSVAAQAAGDLASKLVGEIAKITAETETTQDQTSVQKSKTKSSTEGLLGQSGGLLRGGVDAIKGLFG